MDLIKVFCFNDTTYNRNKRLSVTSSNIHQKHIFQASKLIDWIQLHDWSKYFPLLSILLLCHAQPSSAWHEVLFFRQCHEMCVKNLLKLKNLHFQFFNERIWILHYFYGISPDKTKFLFSSPALFYCLFELEKNCSNRKFHKKNIVK